MESQVLARVVGIAGGVPDRFGLWTEGTRAFQSRSVCEIGVYGGVFSAALLSGADSEERYSMVDCCRHLKEWNKPLNGSDPHLEWSYRRAM